MTKFNIIISQGGNASHKEECNNITKIHGQGGMQKFMDKEECKNFLVPYIIEPTQFHLHTIFLRL
jgi:hypothetical protein